MNVVRGAIIALLLSFAVRSGYSQGDDIVVLQVGPSKVSLKEFENFYIRNSGGWDSAKQSTKEEREHFLDLLTNYKLKLMDAYDRNLINDTDIVRELRE